MELAELHKEKPWKERDPRNVEEANLWVTALQNELSYIDGQLGTKSFFHLPAEKRKYFGSESDFRRWRSSAIKAKIAVTTRMREIKIWRTQANIHLNGILDHMECYQGQAGIPEDLHLLYLAYLALRKEFRLQREEFDPESHSLMYAIGQHLRLKWPAP